MDAPSPRALLDLDDLRQIARWGADCAQRALPLFEAAVPGDARPRAAIAAAREFAAGERRTARLRSLSWAAHVAAREAGDPVAQAAARAASLAAAAAYTHPIASAHQLNHILGPAAYAAQAQALAAGADAAALDAALGWAIEQVPERVREAVRRLPAPAPAQGARAVLIHRLDAALRG
ncbi:hypothetical protein K4L06_04640 [Lysobacter sp. BMK333-48F3]|uniref:putative immunity protein n=1 Tax=Lysobacter sp. BMK333-48F3 TaxID=2867962 RepID=UPI001C8CCEC8|nr:hypothetical protein [Lysobacter sp. BMK333-48F3]MBX9400590.1 hypothetical protein [Lysobacter sp. BMK333-48F3]